MKMINDFLIINCTGEDDKIGLKIKKYFYTIKNKLEFNKYKKNNNLIFENL